MQKEATAAAGRRPRSTRLLRRRGITAQQDQTSLADAKFTVERATVQVATDELQKGRIKGEESKEDLAVAQQKLKVQEATVALHQASDKSRIASLTRQRDQAQADVDTYAGRASPRWS